LAHFADLSDYVLECPVGLEHPLVMGSALDRRASANKFAHHSVEVVFSLFVGVRFEQIDELGQELGVSGILLSGPMLVVIFVGSPHAELAFFWPVEPGLDLLDVFLDARLF